MFEILGRKHKVLFRKIRSSQAFLIKQICLVLIVFCPLFASCNQSNIVIITDSYQNDFLKNYLDNHNILYKSQDGYFEITENKESLRVLQKLARIQIVRVEIDIQNINNINSTGTLEKHYRKKYLSVDKDGLPVINEDRKSKPRLKYDPTHPDSIRKGGQKGWVVFPNIVLNEELLNLESDIALYDSICKYLSSIDEKYITKKIYLDHYIHILETAHKMERDRVYDTIEYNRFKKN